MLIAAFKQIA